MGQSVQLAAISDVQFGPIGGINISAKGTDGEKIHVIVPLAELPHLIPRLMHAATAAISPGLPLEGGAIPICFVPVADAKPFAAKETMEPVLTLHTPAGTFQFHFPPAAAARYGKELHALGVASSMPEPSKLN